MFEMLEELELAIGALGEDRRAKRLHDLLYGHGLPCELVLGGAACPLMSMTRPPARTGTNSTLTIQDRMLPCRPAAGRCICARSAPARCPPAQLLCRASSPHVPARDLERRAEDLGTHKLRHVARGARGQASA